MKYIFTTFLLLVSTFLFAQQINLDAAQKFNQAWINKANNSYTLVGGFRVVGTPYLFGEKQTGKVWAKEGQSIEQTTVSYNTFRQELEVSLANYAKPITKEFQTVDSFQMSVIADGQPMVLQFINGRHAGFSEKTFLQVLATGKYKLYKQYKTDLGNLTDNHALRDVRQFELFATYWYADEDNNFKKLRINPRALSKEFSQVKDISIIVNTELLATNTELVLKQIFAHLNN